MTRQRIFLTKKEDLLIKKRGIPVFIKSTKRHIWFLFKDGIVKKPISLLVNSLDKTVSYIVEFEEITPFFNLVISLRLFGEEDAQAI